MSDTLFDATPWSAVLEAAGDQPEGARQAFERLCVAYRDAITHWSLGPAPFGARINLTTGVLQWTPACSQGSSTNTITVWATDRARTNISDAITFTVAVKECVAPQLGRLVLRAGDTGRLPIDLITSVPLTNLATFIKAETNRLVPVNVEPTAMEVCDLFLELLTNVPFPGPLPQEGEGVYLATLGTCSNQFLSGTPQVAWLLVSAPANQSSAFVPVEIGPSIGTQPGGGLVTNYVTQAGRVVIVGEERLLEAERSTNGQVCLTLYAPVGSTKVLRTASELAAPGLWMPWQQIVPPNLFHTLSPLPATNRTVFIRAVRE